MRKITIFFLFFLFCHNPLYAQQNPEWDAAHIQLQLEKLNVVGRVLYVAAHPDDENTSLLAWLANDKKYRTAYLALTRGDGGQNLVGDEQGAYLGLIRTQELLAARRTDGAQQFFSSAVDFGYSKTAKETFDFWGHQRILGDVVWIIRKFRPNIIICRFPEDERAGHGNHWASAVLAHEAFKAAADPTKFPEQLRFVKTWQAKRVLWNTFRFGGVNTTSSEQFSINIGGYNPLLGKGYGEIAAHSRSMHKSQGFGVSPSYGKNMEYFKTIAGTPPQKTLMDGIHTDWSGVKGGDYIGGLISKTIEEFDAGHPEKSIPLLLQIKKAIAALPDTSLKNIKTKEVDQLLLACSGILLKAFSGQPYVVAGRQLDVHIEAINRSAIPVELKSVTLFGTTEKTSVQLNTNELKSDVYKIPIPDNTPISQPYWLQKKHPPGHYVIPNQQLIGLPETPSPLKASFTLSIAGQLLTIERKIKYIHTDAVRGEVVDPLVVAPAVTANVKQEVYVFTSQQPQQIAIALKNFKDNVSGNVHLRVPENFKVQNNDQPFSLKNAGSRTELHFTVIPDKPIRSSSGESLQVEATVDGKKYKRGIKVIQHNYIPAITVFPLSEAKLVAMPLELSGHQIGYIMGAGDRVPEALTQMGCHVKLLNDQELSGGDLDQFDAVVIGIRAYNTREQLKYAQDRLMQYVKNGGTLVVQYNKNRNLYVGHPGPYPFNITRSRVTDETAKVNFLLPEDPVLNYPNKISEADFKGWIQERGVYFLQNVDAHYRKPLAMKDPGEAPLDGSLIVCKYGKGKYVYTGLDFFRELPAGVPGAFRLFANLIANGNSE